MIPVQKIKFFLTVISGCPDPNPLHTQHIADLSLKMMKKIHELRDNGVRVDCKIGFHTGGCVAGIVGNKGEIVRLKS